MVNGFPYLDLKKEYSNNDRAPPFAIPLPDPPRISPKFLQQMKREFVQFLWADCPPRIKTNTLILSKQWGEWVSLIQYVITKSLIWIGANTKTSKTG